MSLSGPRAPTGPAARPVVLTSLASAALLDGRGDLELLRETRGAPIDWGGVYGQGVRLTGPWRLSLAAGSDVTSLPECRVDSTPAPGRWTTRHRWRRFDVVQEIVAVPSPPGVVRGLSISVADGAPAPLHIVSSFSPFLLPVLVEGVRPTSFHLASSPAGLAAHQRGFALDFRSSVAQSHLFLNRGSWLGGTYQGPVDEIGSDHEVTVGPDQPTRISFLLAGGLVRDPISSPAATAVLSDPLASARALDEADHAWIEATPVLRFPDEPSLERAYGLARSALRRLYTAPGDDLTGLVAGFPWYAAIWCRDLAWMLPAVLWLGDFDWAARSLSSVFRYQSRADLPILGGEIGELPMQISPGSVFLYGSSDTTLYYPELVRQYLRHSADRGRVAGWSSALAVAIAWAQARSDPTTGLVRNGGEVEAIAVATGAFSRVRYGIDAPDTTIWDSTDRRDHAIDLQVLWRDALLAGAELLATGPDNTRSHELTQIAERVARSVRELYPWTEERYLYDSLRENHPVPRLRPNALQAVGSGILDPATARALVLRAARDDLTTSWGVRTLSTRDAAYDPQAYHDGQVWTIATAWAAEAALAVGEVDLGLRYLRTIGGLFEAEGGWANECYRGDRPEAFNSCFVLGFSIAPFLTTLFERLWGLSVDARVPRLDVHPMFPDRWRSASLERLRVGPGTVNLDWTPERLRVVWSGPNALEVCVGESRLEVTGGHPADFANPAAPR